MYVVYNPKLVLLVEALCATKEAAEAACRGNAALKNASFANYAAEAAEAVKSGAFSNSGLHYVVYHERYPLLVEAITRTPEMALDVMLNDYVWRVIPQWGEAQLYVCRRDVVADNFPWKFVKWVEKRASFSETFTRLVTEFGRLSHPELELALRLAYIEEYRKISDNAFNDALKFPLNLVANC